SGGGGDAVDRGQGAVDQRRAPPIRKVSFGLTALPRLILLAMERQTSLQGPRSGRRQMRRIAATFGASMAGGGFVVASGLSHGRSRYRGPAHPRGLSRGVGAAVEGLPGLPSRK